MLDSEVFFCSWQSGESSSVVGRRKELADVCKQDTIIEKANDGRGQKSILEMSVPQDGCVKWI